MARPLLHGLRATFGDAELSVIGTPAARLLERETLWRQWLPAAEARRPSDLARRLGGQGFDAALILPPSFSSAWALRDCQVERRVGFAGELRSWLLTDAWRRPPRGETHLSEEYLQLGARIGVRATAVPPLVATADDQAAAAARLRALAIDDGAFAILGPGANYGPAKRWPHARFVAIGRRLVAAGRRVLVAGADRDRDIALPIASEIGSGAHAIAGETSLGEQLALCAAARVTITNDSGLAHLAAAGGAATVVIFGSTSSAWTAPRGPRVVVVQRAPVCSPCFQRTCRIGYRCLEAIAVEAVERACRSVAA